MSDREFENYLTLIGRLLRLNSKQREAIGEELRDHFESRLAELMGGGFSQAQAVQMALEEFGDAAGLATQFSKITQTRNRRILMRCTLASIVGLAAALIIALAVWPDNHAGKLMPRAVADPNPDPFAVDPVKTVAADSPAADAVHKNFTPSGPVPGESPDRLNAQTEDVLSQFGHFEFDGIPLTDVADYLADFAKLQIVFDSVALKDAGLDPTTIQVTMSLHHVRLKTFLDLILREKNLSYTISDGIISITTREKADTTLTTRVYDCQDILSASDPLPRVSVPRAEVRGSGAFDVGEGGGIGGGMGGASGTAKPDAKASAADTKAAGTGGGGGLGGPAGEVGKGIGGGTSNPAHLDSPADELIDIITSSTAPPSWSEQGGPGSIAYYKGLLVVNQTSELHEQVAMLLDQISHKLTARKQAGK